MPTTKRMRFKEAYRAYDETDRRLTVFSEGQIVRVAPLGAHAIAYSHKTPDEGHLIPLEILEIVKPVGRPPTKKARVVVYGTKFGRRA